MTSDGTCSPIREDFLYVGLWEGALAVGPCEEASCLGLCWIGAEGTGPHGVRHRKGCSGPSSEVEAAGGRQPSCWVGGQHRSGPREVASCLELCWTGAWSAGLLRVGVGLWLEIEGARAEQMGCWASGLLDFSAATLPLSCIMCSLEPKSCSPKFFCRLSDVDGMSPTVDACPHCLLLSLHPSCSSRCSARLKGSSNSHGSAFSCYFYVAAAACQGCGATGVGIGISGPPIRCLNLEILNRGSLIKGGDLEKDLDPILQSNRIYIKVVSDQSPIEGQFEFCFLFLKHLFQHGRCVPSSVTNATSLERIGTKIFIPSKGFEGLKRIRGR
ncbi:hypothetical protein M9H77_07415 [Catharanthus roseus]|uniref:Uncharacterized protein n=1 Tax=Catharanthus roseus TaxID=4058 RepID=A0ACC0BUX0_CATRO|nr:hypothetical protein M9H77_07415 [Catharanthus roseus]